MNNPHIIHASDSSIIGHCRRLAYNQSTEIATTIRRDSAERQSEMARHVMDTELIIRRHREHQPERR